MVSFFLISRFPGLKSIHTKSLSIIENQEQKSNVLQACFGIHLIYFFHVAAFFQYMYILINVISIAWL